METFDEKKLKTSWTKFDAVKIIELVSSGKSDPKFLAEENINIPIIKSFFGINDINDPLPSYWIDIINHPKQLRQFALISAIFMHVDVIRKFAKHSIVGQMSGTFIVEERKKEDTNIRSALVVSGASLEKFRRQREVPFNFMALFENGKVGIMVKGLFSERLKRIGYTLEQTTSTKTFIDICYELEFIKALGLTKEQFKKWVNGGALTEGDIFAFKQLKIYNNIPMLSVNQWMNDWNDVNFTEDLRSKPLPKFYLFSIDARVLKRISDVHRRAPGGKDVQRKASSERINEIKNYIEGGFPWSTLSEVDRNKRDNFKLKMPGLLPTAIIANLIPVGTERNRKTLKEEDEIKIIENWKGLSTLKIPDNIFDDENWNPDLKPLEIIDGQHRLWAFDENQALSGNYELPVVLFNNLDRAWQAYLFYTINIKPVKINTSLGFDLYPLLRTQEWLENTKDGLLAYRETRSQEIVEALWLYETSSWKNRINMLGEAGGDTMSQAAYIRALVNSFFKKRKGIFSDNIKSNQIIEWNRAQQAAFIILLWKKIEEAVQNCHYEWAEMIRNEETEQKALFDSETGDRAFLSKNSFLSRDQGVRGLLTFSNDFFFAVAQYPEIDFNFPEWEGELDEKSISNESITTAIELFNRNEPLINLLDKFSFEIAKVDWRTVSARFNNETEKEHQMKYRGSGGYSEFWKDIHSQFLKSKDNLVSKYAHQIQK